jgi:nucleotide-binding universal stress UspA family protein
MTLLVPIDLTEASSWEKVLPQAFALAGATDAEVAIMTVVPEIPGGLDYRYAIRGETGGSENLDVDALLDRARSRLQELGQKYAPNDACFEIIARYGSISEEVLDVAAELPASQIVMASHRPGLADFLIGANTDRIVRHATCTVTVVRD